jgi:hypothetical protein
MPSMIIVATIAAATAPPTMSVGERPAGAMRHHDPTSAGRKVREDEERAEPIMRHEADVPPILDESGGRAGREVPSGVDAKICPCENKDRVHVAQHVKGEVDAPDAIWKVRKRSLGAAVRSQTKKSPVPTWKRKSATASG